MQRKINVGQVKPDVKKDLSCLQAAPLSSSRYSPYGRMRDISFYRSGVRLTFNKALSSREAVTRDLRIFVSDGMVNERKEIRRCRITDFRHDRPFYINNQRAFTLIELLVVVLIIGILAAVAVPQYQQAVLKARMSEMQTMVRKIYDAKQVHKLANGSNTENFEDLDLDFGRIHQTLKYIVYTTHFACYGWGACGNKLNASDFYISLVGSPAQWKCCWGGENKKIQKACQSYFPNGEYVPNAPQMGFENEQCIVAPL